MKKAIVTGGAGFIGSHVVENLLKRGIEVLIIDNCSTTKYHHVVKFITKMKSQYENFLGFVNYDLSDLNDCNRLKNIFFGFDYVFHLAAHPRVEPSIENPIFYHKQNVDSTLNVLEAARQTGIKKVIFSSSSSVYGNPVVLPSSEQHPINPMSPYGLHKQIGDEYCKLYSSLYGLNTVSLRYFNVFGERQPTEGAYVPVVGIWMGRWKSGLFLEITGDGTQTRDFVHVSDVAEANVQAALSNSFPGHVVYNVGSGQNHSLNDIASWFGCDTCYIQKRIEPHTTKADVSKIKRDLGWKPTIDLKTWVENWLKDRKQT